MPRDDFFGGKMGKGNNASGLPGGCVRSSLPPMLETIKMPPVGPDEDRETGRGVRPGRSQDWQSGQAWALPGPPILAASPFRPGNWSDRSAQLLPTQRALTGRILLSFQLSVVSFQSWRPNLECGDLSPLFIISFFSFRPCAGNSTRRNREASGKAAINRRTPNAEHAHRACCPLSAAAIISWSGFPFR